MLPSLDLNQDLEVQSLAGFQLPHRAWTAADDVLDSLVRPAGVEPAPSSASTRRSAS
jgi:hypothetical protein